jgi:class 3 adenylate cyclase
MSWDYETSKQRIENYIGALSEINVEKLTRDADLDKLLSETECREIFGAHVYFDVPNFANLASAVEGEDYKRVVQAVHIYQRELTRIVEKNFGGVRIHFQGPKLHALFFRPIDEADELSTRAVLLMVVLRKFLLGTFNSAFPKLLNLSYAAGADIGNAIGTQDGMKGDRELLFIGSPANHAAKVIRSSRELRITESIYENLPDTLQSACTACEDGAYTIGAIADENFSDLMQALQLDWDAEESSSRVEEDKKQFPLNGIEYSEAEVAIDFDALGPKNNKKLVAASIFADVDGFTRFVDSAQTDEEKESALRALHVIRKEMASVVKHDFDGLRVQYQGDRVQGLFHLPKDEAKKFVGKTVRAAIALQSSMEHTIKACLPQAKSLGLAIGIDVGVTLASNLGTRGERDRICIGEAVEAAARIQEKCHRTEIGISSAAYALLSEEMQKLFTEDKKRGLFLAQSLTEDKLERALKAGSYGATVFVNSSGGTTSVNRRNEGYGRQVDPPRSWSE